MKSSNSKSQLSSSTTNGIERNNKAGLCTQWHKTCSFGNISQGSADTDLMCGGNV